MCDDFFDLIELDQKSIVPVDGSDDFQRCVRDMLCEIFLLVQWKEYIAFYADHQRFCLDLPQCTFSTTTVSSQVMTVHHLREQPIGKSIEPVRELFALIALISRCAEVVYFVGSLLGLSLNISIVMTIRDHSDSACGFEAFHSCPRVIFFPRRVGFNGETLRFVECNSPW